MPRVIISSGHSTQTPGTQANGLVEYDVARQIAKAILPHLRQNGLISLLVPPNLDLDTRIDWINKTGYDESTNDVAIEIHINDGGKRGIEGWFEGEDDNKSKTLTNFILQSLVEDIKLTNQGLRSEYEHSLGSIAFLNETNPIASLIECCYIDNVDDAEFLKKEENIQALGKSIAKGIMKYFGMQYREIIAPVAQANTQQPVINNSQNIVASNDQNNIAVPKDADNKDSSKLDTTVANTPQVTSSLPNNSFATNTTFPSNNNSFGNTGFDNNWALPQNQFGNNMQAPAMMSRDERKEMIKKQYVKVLGREPNDNDLNYFLNLNISEPDLLKKMIDSQEHADLVKSRQEVIDIKQKIADQTEELESLRAKNEDNKKILFQMHQAIQQKNYALGQLHNKLKSLNYVVQQSAQLNAQEKPNHKYKGTFLDKVFRAFSDVFE
jgi:hypothetical protein